ncbi:MAG: hypothetical protein GF308_09035 [Candidatus Heimdallarchaeota archaeon]|nr:hypothetical protein [Candidatus Heimdallarchaeota archaeon]
MGISGEISLVKDEVKNAIQKVTDYISQLENDLKDTRKQLEIAQEKAKTMSKKRNSAENKLAELEKQMEELSSVYEELRKQKITKIDLQEVMRLYVLLTEQVLHGNAHIRILTLLHGKKEIMTKEELSKATGILPAETLKAIFDLRNNGLVNYDDETAEVSLVQRIFV